MKLRNPAKKRSLAAESCACAHTPVLCEGILGTFFLTCSKCGKDGPEEVTEAEARSAWAKAFKVQSQSIKPKHSRKKRGW